MHPTDLQVGFVAASLFFIAFCALLYKMGPERRHYWGRLIGSVFIGTIICFFTSMLLFSIFAAGMLR